MYFIEDKDGCDVDLLETDCDTRLTLSYQNNDVGNVNQPLFELRHAHVTVNPTGGDTDRPSDKWLPRHSPHNSSM